VIGGGRAVEDVKSLFAGFSPGRINWLGELSSAEIATELLKGGIYVWPGCGEAYGLAYLEAQAAGLPVVAQATAGVPEVVVDQVTGLLTPDGDIAAYARAIAHLLDDELRRGEMGANAFDFVHAERSLPIASQRLDAILRDYLGASYER
jgi:glycosyltransferase involved in cell wall biosynthesis